MSSPHIIDLSERDFQSVIDRSHQQLVLVDFWAPWCAPCRSLTPILEKIVEEYAGKVLLAKLNTDENQVIAGQVGVRSLPTVIFLRDGQMVHQFTGAQREVAVRDMIEAIIGPAEPGEAEPQDGVDETVDVDAELASVEQKLAEKPDDPELQAERARWLAQAQRFDEAREALQALGESARGSPAGQRAGAWLHFATISEELVPDDDHPGQTLRRAAGDTLAGRFDAAGDALLELMRHHRGYGDDAARRSLLHLLELIDDTALAATLRRKMATLLF